MEKVKQYLLELEAEKTLGQEKYKSIKKEFRNRYESLCSEFLNGSKNINIKQMLDKLKNLKNYIWVDGLMQFMGGAVVGASIYRADIYGLEETIISSVVGILISGISTLVKKGHKQEFNELKDKFINLVNSGNSDALKNEQDMDMTEDSKYISVAYDDEVNNLLDR